MDFAHAPLSTRLKEAMRASDSAAVPEIATMAPSDLARALGVAPEVATDYRRELDAAYPFARRASAGAAPPLPAGVGMLGSSVWKGAANGQTALALLERQATQQRLIATFSRQLDEMLGGGIAIGEVTEICGVPGVGKTQLGMQLCVNATLPSEFGGLEGGAVYIDTEGSFVPQRLEAMAQGLWRTLQGKLKAPRHAGNAELRAKVNERHTVAAMMEDVTVFRCTDLVSQTATIMHLPSYLERHGHVRLVVVDSIAFHYRYSATAAAAMAMVASSGGGGGSGAALTPSGSLAPAASAASSSAPTPPPSLSSVAAAASAAVSAAAFLPSDGEAGARARHLQQVSLALHSAAATYGVAVVIVNHMTTRLGGGGMGAARGKSPGMMGAVQDDDSEADGDEVMAGTGSAAAVAAGGGSSGSALAGVMMASGLEGALPNGTLLAALPPGPFGPVPGTLAAAAAGEVLASLAAGSGSVTRLVPALGEVWAHAPTRRIIFGWNMEGTVRLAQLVKAPADRPGMIAFAITSDGVRSDATAAAVGSGGGSADAVPTVAGRKRRGAEVSGGRAGDEPRSDGGGVR